MSLISRKLLTPDEVLSIENPYSIVMIAGKPPVITNLPDISQTHFNTLNGMGTKEENQKLRIERENIRESRPIENIKIWDIWNKNTKEETKEKLEEQEKEDIVEDISQENDTNLEENEQKKKESKLKLIQDKFKENIKGDK